MQDTHNDFEIPERDNSNMLCPHRSEYVGPVELNARLIDAWHKVIAETGEKTTTRNLINGLKTWTHDQKVQAIAYIQYHSGNTVLRYLHVGLFDDYEIYPDNLSFSYDYIIDNWECASELMPYVDAYKFFLDYAEDFQCVEYVGELVVLIPPNG